LKTNINIERRHQTSLRKIQVTISYFLIFKATRKKSFWNYCI
jgi:hypothetical protein